MPAKIYWTKSRLLLTLPAGRREEQGGHLLRGLGCGGVGRGVVQGWLGGGSVPSGVTSPPKPSLTKRSKRATGFGGGRGSVGRSAGSSGPMRSCAEHQALATHHLIAPPGRLELSRPSRPGAGRVSRASAHSNRPAALARGLEPQTCGRQPTPGASAAASRDQLRGPLAHALSRRRLAGSPARSPGTRAQSPPPRGVTCAVPWHTRSVAGFRGSAARARRAPESLARPPLIPSRSTMCRLRRRTTRGRRSPRAACTKGGSRRAGSRARPRAPPKSSRRQVYSPVYLLGASQGAAEVEPPRR
jgi:hypothetical protein